MSADPTATISLGVLGVTKVYTLPARPFSPARRVQAVAGVDLTIHSGRRVALVGESGSGKSTLSRILLDLERPTSGEVRFNERPLRYLGRSGHRQYRRSVQAVFQNPYTSLDPLQKVADSVAEPLLCNGWRRRPAIEKATELLERVGLPADAGSRYPTQFSGGQRQRIAIARALTLDPPLLILDEPVSSLDASARTGVLDLLAEQAAARGIGFLLITHDLSIIRGLVDEVMVMHLGLIKERGTPAEILDHPKDPYTQTLLESVPPGRPTPGWPKLRELDA